MKIIHCKRDRAFTFVVSKSSVPNNVSLFCFSCFPRTICQTRSLCYGHIASKQPYTEGQISQEWRQLVKVKTDNVIDQTFAPL